MSISVADNFSYQGTKPLDARIKFDTVANMKAYAENSLYDGCLAYVTGTKTYYTYDSTNTTDSTTGKWREFNSGGGGASALSELTDTNISTPTDGQVLKYDGTNNEWVNSVENTDVIQGYAYQGESTSPLDFIHEMNRHVVGTPITVPNESIFANESCSAMIAVVSNDYAMFCYLDEPFTIHVSAPNINNEVYVYRWKDSPSKTGRGVAAPNRVISGSLYDTTFYQFPSTWLNSQITDTGHTVQIFSTSNVTYAKNPNLTSEDYANYYADNTTTIAMLGALTFYADSAHTIPIVPKIGAIYIDKPSNQMYRWDGNQYVPIGGSASSVEDLTDTEIDTETLADGQILQYNGTDKKWENADLPEVDTTKLYSTEDTAETALEDADYVPFYDSSATAKKKSLWSNIKSVLKTYFDTIYSTFSGSYNDLSDKPTIVSTRETPASGGTTLSLVNTGDMYNWNLSVPTILSATLSAGSTSVTFSNVPTTGDYLITPFTSVVGLDYDSISQSGSTVTVTYSAQSSAVTVYLKIEGV